MGIRRPRRHHTEFALPAPDGSDDIDGKGLANCKECGSKRELKGTAPVASFPANEWGVHDMHGNVYEWVEDCVAWTESGDCSDRMLRGGSWDHPPDDARSAARDLRGMPDARSTSIGFRVVCSSPSSGAER